jgi:hypothetical protein
MASEFDEALQKFLRVEGLMLHVGSPPGNETLQVQLTRAGEGEALAVTESPDLDVAINLAVDQYLGHPMRGIGEEGPIGFERRDLTVVDRREGLYAYRGASIELSGPAGGRWYATIRFRNQVQDIEARSEQDALWAAQKWIDEAPELRENRKWSTAYKNDLPDSAFLYVREDCVEYKDEQGRSHPLDCRELPVKNHLGNYDYAHVKNAISRSVQLKDVPVATQRRLQAEARRIFDREFGGS